jgi:glycosyltransferase involved in cell wall biosynthesis
MHKAGRTHLLCIIPSLAGGGAERVMTTLLRHFDRSRFRLTLGVVDPRSNGYRSEVPEDVEFIGLDSTRVRYSLHKIIRLAWQLKPDVVFSTLGHLNLALAAARPLLPRTTRLITRETSVVSENLSAYRHKRGLHLAYSMLYPKIDLIICQSLAMRDDLVMNFGVSAKNTIVIHNPLDVDRIRKLAADPSVATDYEKDAINLVAAGRLSHEKGYDILLDALALCNVPRLRLTILGEGQLRDDLEVQASRLGLGKRVRFVGFQENPYPFFSQADAFVLSSRFEGLPNVVLEALACGTQVIATPAPGGLNDIAKMTQGLLIASSITEDSLARAISTFAMSDRSVFGLPKVESWAVELIVPRYERVFLPSEYVVPSHIFRG